MPLPGRSPDSKRRSWRRGWDSNPRVGMNPLHDFESCAINRTLPPLRDCQGPAGPYGYPITRVPTCGRYPCTPSMQSNSNGNRTLDPQLGVPVLDEHRVALRDAKVLKLDVVAVDPLCHTTHHSAQFSVSVLAAPGRFERPTFDLGGRCSILLSYGAGLEYEN